jgi:predicted alpha/beta hydrolase family esterase
MKTAIFVHGHYRKEKYYDPNSEMINLKDYTLWLLKQLTIRDYLAEAPLMPTPFWPIYEEWKKELERYDLDENTTLIGQSYGGGFLVRWLSETDKKVGKVFLVAPYINPNPDNHPDDEKRLFFDNFEVKRDLAGKTAGLTIFESSNDADSIEESYKFLSDNVDNFKTITLENRGHFTTTTGGEINRTFPELLEEILK